MELAEHHVGTILRLAEARRADELARTCHLSRARVPRIIDIIKVTQA
jgi:hypothetical protein